MHDMCTDCGGSGIKVTHLPLGPGMMQQIQSVCTDCGGSGDYIRDKDKYKKCRGSVSWKSTTNKRYENN